MREPILVINAGCRASSSRYSRPARMAPFPGAHGQLLATGSRSFLRTHRLGAAGDRLPQLGYAAAYAEQFTRDKLVEHKACIREYGEDNARGAGVALIAADPAPEPPRSRGQPPVRCWSCPCWCCPQRTDSI